MLVIELPAADWCSVVDFAREKFWEKKQKVWKIDEFSQDGGQKEIDTEIDSVLILFRSVSWWLSWTWFYLIAVFVVWKSIIQEGKL